MIKNIGLGVTGSFCTHAKILAMVEGLVKKGYNVIPILTPNVVSMDTRFGRAKDFVGKLRNITGNEIITTIVEAEPIGPKNMIDILVIAPCTGNTLSKLANAITDNAVTMVAKAHMRNNKKVVIALSSNDGLGLSMPNLAKLMTTKNVFFVPFEQDDCVKKPKSLVADFGLTEKTMLLAEKGEQLQPILIRG